MNTFLSSFVKKILLLLAVVTATTQEVHPFFNSFSMPEISMFTQNDEFTAAALLPFTIKACQHAIIGYSVAIAATTLCCLAGAFGIYYKKKRDREVAHLKKKHSEYQAGLSDEFELFKKDERNNNEQFIAHFNKQIESLKQEIIDTKNNYHNIVAQEYSHEIQQCKAMQGNGIDQCYKKLTALSEQVAKKEVEFQKMSGKSLFHEIAIPSLQEIKQLIETTQNEISQKLQTLKFQTLDPANTTS